MRLFGLMWVGSVFVLGLVACGRPGETASTAVNKVDSNTVTNSEMDLADGSNDPGVWPVGRLASYVIDVKCDGRVVATVTGANSAPNSLVLPADVNSCLGILKSISLANRSYTPRSDIPDSDFKEGGKVEFVEKSDPTNIMGILIERQIALGGRDFGSMVFRFTGITERRSIHRGVFSPVEAKVRSIFVANEGQMGRGYINLDFGKPASGPVGAILPAFLISKLKSPGGVRVANELLNVSKLTDEDVGLALNSPIVPVVASYKTGVIASLPMRERMTLIVTGVEILTVKTTSITVGYSSASPDNNCASEQAIVDRNQTFSWRSPTRAGDDIQTSMPGFAGYVSITGSALNNDPDTVNFVCRLNGFAGGQVAETGRFLTGADNKIFQWDPNQRKLNPVNSRTRNDTIRAYVCRGKLLDVCKQDPSWIFRNTVN